MPLLLFNGKLGKLDLYWNMVRPGQSNMEI